MSLFKKTNKIKNSNNQAFTLIELLVVIAIIGLLASVVLTSLNVAREKAQWSKFIQETDQIMTAIEMYVADHGGDYMMLAQGDNWGPDIWPNGIDPIVQAPIDYIIAMTLDDQGGYIKYDPNYGSTIFDKQYDLPPYDNINYSALVIEFVEDISYSDRWGASNCRAITGIEAPYYIFTYDETFFKTSYISDKFVSKNGYNHYCLIPKIRN